MKVPGLKIKVDNREQINQHITNYFDKKCILYEVGTPKSGDYTCEINGMMERVIIERKNSITELCGNFTKNRQRFINEFKRMSGTTKILLIEEGRYEDIVTGRYGSDMIPKA